MKRIEIRHTTHYQYQAAVRLGSHVLRLRPREGHDLRIASSLLNIAPNAVLAWHRDFYDNVLGIATFDQQAATELTIESRVEVDLYEMTPLNFVVEEYALHYPLSYRPEEQVALRPFLEPVYRSHPRLAKWLKPFRRTPSRTETFALVDRINQQIHGEFDYEIREEAGVLRPEEVLRRGKGSCRDVAALMLETCRRLGIAARFVSGYVHDPATEAEGGAASHAWAEVYLPGAGWKGFDPTHATIVGPDHIPVAVHHHPEAIPPVAGTFTGSEGSRPQMFVDVQITRLAG